jgi:SAM-dependent methyltransferase
MEHRKLTPWDYVHEGDIRDFGSSAQDKDLVQKWARIFLFSGQLPYMWNQAPEVKKLMYDYLDLHEGDRVLLIGERLDACGFEAEVRKRIGSNGKAQVFDYTDHSRSLIKEGKSGRFRYDFSNGFDSNYFDAILLAQAANNCSDWKEAARDLARVLKPGKMLVAAEITLGGPTFRAAINSDLHLRAWIEKLMVGAPFILSGELYTGPEELLAAFDGYLQDPAVFKWCDIFLLHGRKTLFDNPTK